MGTQCIEMRESGAAHAVGEFRIEERQPLDRVVVLSLRGEADLHVAGELRDRLAMALDAGTSTIILDLSEVTFLDSMALGVLVGAAKRARADGGELRLVVPGTSIRRILEVTLLDRVFPLDRTLAESLAAVRAD